MVINTGFGVKWIDEFFDYELQPINQPAIPPVGPGIGPDEQTTDSEPVAPDSPAPPSLPTVADINER